MRTIKRSLILNLTAVLLFILLMTALVSRERTYSAQTSIENQYALLSDELQSAVLRREDSHARLAATLAYSRDVQDALFSKQPATRYRSILNARQTMFSDMRLDPGLRGLMVWAGDSARIETAGAYLGLDRDTLAPYLEGDVPSGRIALIPHRGSYCLLYVYPFRSLLGEGRRSADARCLLQYDLTAILDVSSFHPDLITAYALLAQGQTHPIGAASPVFDAWQAAGGDAPVTRVASGGETYNVLRLALPGIEGELLCAIPQRLLVSTRPDRSSFLLLTLGAMIVLAITFASFILLARDIHRLISSVEDVRAGRAETLPSVRNDELNRLATHFNTLLETIGRTNAENLQAQQRAYDAVLARDRAVMAYYRQQIDPHFLFNTLEAMRGMAQYYGVMPLENMIFATSRMLHYSLYAPFQVPFEEEVKCARNYITLMNQRRQDAYDYVEQVSPEALAHTTLSLILQPLVENAIRHGGKHIHRRLCITLSAQVDAEGFLCVTLQDNGCGMDAAQLAEVRALIADPDNGAESRHIGLRNIAKRLASADSRCVFTVASEPDAGTEILLRIPQLPEVDPRVAGAGLMPEAEGLREAPAQ